MVAVGEEKNVYEANFRQLEKDAPNGAPASVRRLRQEGLARFGELGFPGARDEDWKFTSLASLAKIPFRPAQSSKDKLPGLAQLEKQVFPLGSCQRLVFWNGFFRPELSAMDRLPRGVIVSGLAEALTRHAALIEPHLARYARHQDYALTALNTAFLRDGSFVYVPADVVVAEPLFLVYLSSAAEEGSVSHPRNLVVVGNKSQVSLVEYYAGLDQQLYFTNPVTEVVAGADCNIDHYKVQRESIEAFHLAATQIEMARGSKFSSHFISLGGGLVRNEVRARLGAEGCECTLNGLYLGAGRQHIDNHTVIDHALPRCQSHELYKGILDGEAHGVFNGKIFVRQDAQKTDAKQTNQTLLLSDSAVIDTKPQLEIFADDVKCTHGATVGQLSEDMIFYLRSRGLGAQEARSLLTFAFANDIVRRIQVQPVRAQLEELLLVRAHLPPAEEAS